MKFFFGITMKVFVFMVVLLILYSLFSIFWFGSIDNRRIECSEQVTGELIDGLRGDCEDHWVDRSFGECEWYNNNYEDLKRRSSECFDEVENFISSHPHIANHAQKFWNIWNMFHVQ
jgi:hypothetical protein